MIKKTIGVSFYFVKTLTAQKEFCAYPYLRKAESMEDTNTNTESTT